MSRLIRIACIISCFSMLCTAHASIDTSAQEPSGGAMAADAFIARPVGIALTVAGTLIWLAALPFSAMGGNTGSSAEALIIKPFRGTFMRCLGCEFTATPGSSDTTEHSHPHEHHYQDPHENVYGERHFTPPHGYTPPQPQPYYEEQPAPPEHYHPSTAPTYYEQRAAPATHYDQAPPPAYHERPPARYPSGYHQEHRRR